MAIDLSMLGANTPSEYTQGVNGLAGPSVDQLATQNKSNNNVFRGLMGGWMKGVNGLDN